MVRCGDMSLAVSMTDITPSLVEAAARAIRDALVECREAKPPDVGTSWPDYMVAATAAHEAVGDALRLEGAQAERERVLAVLDDLAVWKQGSGVVPPWRIKDAIREALGGVHPEASDG